MKILTWLSRFETLNELILEGEATSIEVIGKKMSLSTRQVNHLIYVMKRNGAPLAYDRKLKRFVYKEPGSFEAKFEYVPPKRGHA